MRSGKWRWIAGGAGVALIAAGVLWAWSESIITRSHTARPESARAAGAAERIAGRRLAAVFGCPHCHGDGLQGKSFYDERFVARVHAPNLTLAAQGLSDAQLAQAIRQGVRSDGTALFEMPSEMYMHLTDTELSSVLAYLRSLPAGGTAMPPIEWRLGGRWKLVRREIRPVPELVAAARIRAPVQIDGHARGRHVALTTCSECHGPDLGGLPGIPDLAIAAAYDETQFGRLMRTGIARGDRELPLMSETARVRFSQLTDDEVEALHAYLKSRATALQRSPVK